MTRVSCIAARRLRVFAVFALFVFTATSISAFERCGDAADAALFKVTSWTELGAYWKAFTDCNDGYLGEHISELVSKWLQEPAQIANLSQAIEMYPSLMDLATNHIDMTVNPSRVKAIRLNAEQKCPEQAGVTCSAILERLNELDEEIRAERERLAKE
jgi:hypothetical protein